MEETVKGLDYLIRQSEKFKFHQGEPEFFLKGMNTIVGKRAVADGSIGMPEGFLDKVSQMVEALKVDRSKGQSWLF